MAPRLRPYLTVPTPTWPGIVDAADWLRGEVGGQNPLWGEACLAMGREEAAIAVTIVSAKARGALFGLPFPARTGQPAQNAASRSRICPRAVAYVTLRHHAAIGLTAMREAVVRSIR